MNRFSLFEADVAKSKRMQILAEAMKKKSKKKHADKKADGKKSHREPDDSEDEEGSKSSDDDDEDDEDDEGTDRKAKECGGRKGTKITGPGMRARPKEELTAHNMESDQNNQGEKCMAIVRAIRAVILEAQVDESKMTQKGLTGKNLQQQLRQLKKPQKRGTGTDIPKKFTRVKNPTHKDTHKMRNWMARKSDREQGRGGQVHD